MKFFCFLTLTALTISIASGQSKSLVKKDTVIFIKLGSTSLKSEPVEKVNGINAGAYHCSVINGENKVYTWSDPSAYFIDIPQIDDQVISIATGDIHSTILYKDKTINQFFLNARLNMFFPHQLQNINQVASGPKMSIALNSKGIMYAWGAGKTVKNLEIPIKTYGVKTASVGKEHISFINIKDKVFVWGSHSLGQNKIPKFASKPVKIASGDYHTLVLDEAGKVYAWGNNSQGQCDIPVINGKVKEIAAKNFLSMAVLENEQVVIWGRKNKTEINFSSIGRVKMAALGNDFAVVVIESTPELISKNYQSEIKLISNPFTPSPLKDTVGISMLAESNLQNIQDIPVDNFLGSYVNETFNLQLTDNNTIDFEMKNSNIEEENSTTTITFEGEGNHLKIVNENVNIRKKNSNLHVIVKGSGKSGTITFRDINGEISNSNQTMIIDLDEMGTDYLYPEEYDDKKETFTVTEDLIIDFDKVPFSGITEFPVSDGTYHCFTDRQEFKADNYSAILETADFFTDAFDRAQAYFYCKQFSEGIRILKEAPKDHYNKICLLALFEIYYYGLFGEKPDIALAKGYYTRYRKPSARY